MMRPILDVLPGAPPAAPEGRTDGIGAARTRLEQGLDPGAEVAGAALPNPGAHAIAGRREGDEHHAPVGAVGHAVASCGESLDLDLEDLLPCARGGFGGAAAP